MSPPKRKRLFGVDDGPVRADIGEAQIRDPETAAEDAAAADEQDGPPAPPAGDTLPVARLPPKPSAEPIPGAEYAKDLPERSPFDDGDGSDAENPQETAREIPQVTAPTFRHDASSAAASNPDKNGKNPDVMGIDTDVGNSVDDLHRRTAAAYAALYGANGPPETEAPTQEPFRPSPIEGRQTPEDLQRAWVINTIFGHEGDNFKAVQMMQGINQGLDQRQHAQDQAQLQQWIAQRKGAGDTRPITMAQAQQGVTAGWFSPEAIGKMTQGDFAAMAKANVGSLRSREEATQMKGNVAAQGVLGQNYRDDKKNVITAERANQDAAVRLENGRANERLWEKKFGSVKSPDRQDALVGILSAATQADRGVVKRFMDTGSTDGLTPEKARELQNAADAASLIVTPEALQKAGGDTVKREAARIAAPGIVEAKTLASPEFVHKITKPVEDTRVALEPAYKAVQRLANTRVIVDLGMGPQSMSGLAAIAKAGTSGAGKVLAQIAGNSDVHQDMSRVYKFFAPENHKIFGANFTPSEQGMATVSTGVKFGQGMDAFADPAVIAAYMNDAMTAYKAMRKRAQDELSGNGGLR